MGQGGNNAPLETRPFLVRAEFKLVPASIDDVKQALEKKGKINRDNTASLVGNTGSVHAVVEKTLHSEKKLSGRGTVSGQGICYADACTLSINRPGLKEMKEYLIITGGIYNIALIIFHLLFWRIFSWPETIDSLNPVNKATIQVLNISITFVFFMFAYISLAHTQELVSTPLGKTLLVLMSALWLFRAAQQVYFYKLRHKASIGLAFFFVGGAVIYGVPAFT